jgi:phage replication-related protein YjqB (UPF0714/DUF867 family)
MNLCSQKPPLPGKHILNVCNRRFAVSITIEECTITRERLRKHFRGNELARKGHPVVDSVAVRHRCNNYVNSRCLYGKSLEEPLILHPL